MRKWLANFSKEVVLNGELPVKFCTAYFSVKGASLERDSPPNIYYTDEEIVEIFLLQYSEWFMTGTIDSPKEFRALKTAVKKDILNALETNEFGYLEIYSGSASPNVNPEIANCLINFKNEYISENGYFIELTKKPKWRNIYAPHEPSW